VEKMLTTFNLDHYLRDWQLSDPQPLIETATSHIFTVRSEGAVIILKLFTAIGQEDESSGADSLQIFDGHGAVRLLKHDAWAHLLEYAEGPDLVAIVNQGKDTEATVIIAEVLNQLHRAPAQPAIQPEGAFSLRRKFRSLFRKATADRALGIKSVFTRAETVAERLLATPQNECVLHGDMHHQNIRYHAQRGWLAFDPKGLLYGERTYDATNTLCNPFERPDLMYSEARFLKNAAILADQMTLDLSRLIAFTFAYAALSASWFAESGDDSPDVLKIAAIAENNLRG
jgi:streptomycin 6-kinase